MKTDDFDYYLPEELIAQTPLKNREESRLLVLNGYTGEKEDKKFIILENEYGSYIYKLPYFNALNLLNKDALYYLYFPIFLV